jgi:hypothetical protein
MLGSDAKETAKSASADGRGEGSIAKKVLVPLVATAASAATAYAARKAPALVREKLLPKLKGAVGSGGAGDAVGKARQAIGDTVTGTVSSVTERLGSGDGERGGPDQAVAKKPEPAMSDDQREEERRQRAERRRDRKKALKG